MNVNLCEAKDSIEIYVNPKPNVYISGDMEACENSPAKITAKGAHIYKWDYAGDQTGSTDSIVQPTISQTETFTVTGTDTITLCSNTASWQVRKNNIPTITLTAPEKVCEGEIASITATGANSYVWTKQGAPNDTLSVNNTLTDTPEGTSITYNVSGTSNNCVADTSITIAILSKPVITIDPDNNFICSGDSMVLTATGADMYVWSTGDTKDKIKVSPYSTTEFTLTGTSSNGCTNLGRIVVDVRSLPSFIVSGEQEVCENESATLSATPSVEGTQYQYFWSYDGNEGETGNQVEVIVDNDKVVKVRAVDDSQCEAIVEYPIKKKDFPVVTFIAPTTICEGEQLSIAVFGANTYEWSTGSKTNQMVTIPEYVGGNTYRLKASLNGCEIDTSVTVEVLEKPNVKIEGVNELCSGETLELTATGASTYVWSNGLYKDKLVTNPSITTTYQVTGIADNLCRDSVEYKVIVNPLPKFSIISADEVCTGTELVARASGDATLYHWGFGSRDYTNNSNTTFNDSEVRKLIEKPTYIFVKGQDANGCVNEVSKYIKTITAPEIFATGNSNVCEGDSVVLVGQGGEEYIWEHTWAETHTFNGQEVTYEQTKKHEGAIFQFTPNGTDKVKITGTLGKCSGHNEVTIATKPRPEIAINGTTDICAGNNVSLTATGADTYLWNTGHTTASIYEPIKRSNNFVVVGTAYNGCTSTKSVYVKVHPLPSVKIENQFSSGCPEIGTTFQLAIKDTSLNCRWESFPTNNDIDGWDTDTVKATLFHETTVVVSATNEYQCENTDTIVLKPLEFNPIIFDVQPRIIDENNPIITLSGDYPEKSDWVWSINRTEEIDFEIGVETNDTVRGSYTKYTFPNTYEKDSFLVVAAATDSLGCTYRGEVYIHTWRDSWAPSAFSPNNDGMNDEFGFKVPDLGNQNAIEEFHFIIYNRIGTIVFEGFSADDSWDGKDKEGKDCPQGVYGFVLTYKCNYLGLNKSGDQRGVVTLIR